MQKLLDLPPVAYTWSDEQVKVEYPRGCSAPKPPIVYLRKAQSTSLSNSLSDLSLS